MGTSADRPNSLGGSLACAKGGTCQLRLPTYERRIAGRGPFSFSLAATAVAWNINNSDHFVLTHGSEQTFAPGSEQFNALLQGPNPTLVLEQAAGATGATLTRPDTTETRGQDFLPLSANFDWLANPTPHPTGDTSGWNKYKYAKFLLPTNWRLTFETDLLNVYTRRTPDGRVVVHRPSDSQYHDAFCGTTPTGGGTGGSGNGGVFGNNTTGERCIPTPDLDPVGSDNNDITAPYRGSSGIDYRSFARTRLELRASYVLGKLGLRKVPFLRELSLDGVGGYEWARGPSKNGPYAFLALTYGGGVVDGEHWWDDFLGRSPGRAGLGL